MIPGKHVQLAPFERPQRLFEPDVILPAQLLFDSSRRVTPEKRLMIAILEDAIDCLRKHRLAKRGSGRRIFQDTQRWLLSPGNDWAFSFENICDSLDLSPELIRHRLWKELGDH